MNKLIILLNLRGSYKGGAQRRYINLFKELQKSHSNYYLLMNKSLYEACIADHIFTTDKNIIVRSVKFEQFQSKNKKKITSNGNLKRGNKSSLRKFIGSHKYFLKQLYSWVLYNITLYKVLKQYNINLVYGIFTGGIWSWSLLKLLKLRFIYSYNDSAVSMISLKRIDFLSSEILPLKYADKVDFLSGDIVKLLKRKISKFKQNRVLITPNSFVDYSRFIPKYPKKKLITFSSRLTKQKNPDLLIEAIDILKKKGISNFDVIIIGEGVLLHSLKNKVVELNLENIHFTEGISNPEKIIADSSIFVSIQTDNNYPSQSLIEAMACGNAIIASDVGETRLLVTENEGILVPHSSESIAEAIDSLLTNTDKCARLGQNARKKVLKEQTIERFVEYFIKITQ